MVQSVNNVPTMQETWVRPLVSGRSLGEGNGNPLQYSCLENPMDREGERNDTGVGKHCSNRKDGLPWWLRW